MDYPHRNISANLQRQTLPSRWQSEQDRSPRCFLVLLKRPFQHPPPPPSHQKLLKLFTLCWFSELEGRMEAQMDIVKNRQSVDG